MFECLVRMHVDCRRMGVLSGLFICTKEELEPFVEGRTIYFGEVLGKHSEIEETIKLGDNLEVLSEDPVLIEGLLACSTRTLCGYNPLAFLADMEDAAAELDVD